MRKKKSLKCRLLKFLPSMQSFDNALFVFFLFSELLIEKRSTYIDHVATKPHLPEDTMVEFPDIKPGVFPVLVRDILSTEPVSSK